MPTQVDDLRVGMWITVVANRSAPPEPPPWVYVRRREDGGFSGTPVQIKAISLPFLAVWDGRAMATIDVRTWEVQRVSKQYAEALLHPHVPAAKTQRRMKRQQQREEKLRLAEGRCVNCGERLCQRQVRTAAGLYEWHLWCRTCERDMGAAP